MKSSQLRRYRKGLLLVLAFTLLLLPVQTQAATTIAPHYNAHQDYTGTLTYNYRQYGSKSWSSYITSAVTKWNTVSILPNANELGYANYTAADIPTIQSSSSTGNGVSVNISSNNYEDNFVGRYGDGLSVYTSRHFKNGRDSIMSLNDRKSSGFSTAQYVNTVMHEWGHRFGLNHSTNTGALMYTLTTSVNSVNGDERRACAYFWNRCYHQGS